MNGASLRLFILLALPAVLAVIAWAGLRQRCARGKRAGASLATAAIVILAALTLLTAFSIGSAILPALALLVAGRSLTPTGPLDPAL